MWLDAFDASSSWIPVWILFYNSILDKVKCILVKTLLVSRSLRMPNLNTERETFSLAPCAPWALTQFITTSIISGIRQWQYSSMSSLLMIPVVFPNSLSLNGQKVDIRFTKYCMVEKCSLHLLIKKALARVQPISSSADRGSAVSCVSLTFSSCFHDKIKHNFIM